MWFAQGIDALNLDAEVRDEFDTPMYRLCPIGVQGELLKLGGK